MAKSKFTAVLDQARTVSEPVSVINDVKEKPHRGPGRPRGRRSNPNYEQVTAYIPRAIYDDVKIELIKNNRQEFSALIEELLNEWLDTRKR